jgi:hypothetical protein
VTLGSGIDYRDRPTVLTTDCDRHRTTLYHWNEARREVLVHFFCNRPDKKVIEQAIREMRKEHGEVSGVTVYVDPTVFSEDLVLDTMGFTRDTSREHAGIPYIVLRRAATVTLDRPKRQETEGEKRVREAKELVRSGL